MITENLSTLKIHKLTQAQYDRELANGTLDDNALYLTPDEEIDLSGYVTTEQLDTKADKEQVLEIKDTADTTAEIVNKMVAANYYGDEGVLGYAMKAYQDTDGNPINETYIKAKNVAGADGITANVVQEFYDGYGYEPKLLITLDSSILDEEDTLYYDNLTNAFVDIANENEEYAVGKSNNNVAKVTTHLDGTKIITVLSNTSASIACYSPFTLDLNGKTVTLTDSYLTLYNGGQVKNGSLSASGSGASPTIIKAYYDTVFDNVNFDAALSATGTLTGLLVNSGANLTLNNCEIEIKNTTKITNAIENNGILNINNSTIKGLSPTAGQARGILSKAGKVTINDSYIYTDAGLGQSTAYLNVVAGTEAHLNNSTFFADARTNSNEFTPDQYGRAIYNKGTIYANGITVVGTCYGWSDFAGAITYAQNSTIKSCGHGYYNHGTAYFVDCIFKDEDYDTTLGSRTEEEFIYTADDRQGRYAPIYVGDANDTTQCNLHLDGCTIDSGSANEAIVVHEANGVTHNVYLSNCEIIKTTSGSAIRLVNTTTFAYVGVGGNITTDMTYNPAQMVFTNELYRKKTPNSILNFNDFEALKNYMAQAILGGAW